jgi:hypothetical protein
LPFKCNLQRYSEESLFMATLLMEVVPAEMAFVLHSANPLTGDTVGLCTLNQVDP